MMIQEWLNQASSFLPHSSTAKRDIGILLQHVLGVDESFLYTYPEKKLSESEQTLLKKYVQRRCVGEPIAYILGEKEFYSLTLTINKDVLVPRPDTELLVDLALQKLKNNSVYSVLDLGTGSGAIALAIAKHRPHCHVCAVDVSVGALTVAKQNAEQLDIANAEFIQSNWFERLGDQKFDVIVSNPPYIAKEDKHLQQSELGFEPQSALIAGENGLADLFSIAAQAGKFLRKEGWLLLEHGFEQAKEVANRMKNIGFSDVVSRCDLSGLERVTLGKLA